MTRIGFVVVLALSGASVCQAQRAGQADHPLSFRALHPSSAYSASLSDPVAENIPFRNGFAWSATPGDFLPSWRPNGWEDQDFAFVTLEMNSGSSGRTPVGSANGFSKDSSKEVSDVRTSNLLQNVHGEVGFMYGHSSGKFSRDIESGYIFGTTGDDHFQISAGASYEHSSGDFSRRGR
jgi:hypothetical protein